MKVLAILYKGGDAAKQEPRLLGTVENEVCRVVDAPHIVGVLNFIPSSLDSVRGSSPKDMSLSSVMTRRAPTASSTRRLLTYVLYVI